MSSLAQMTRSTAMELAVIRADVEAALQRAIRVTHPTLDLSADELRHARRWSQLVVALMDPDCARLGAEAMDAAVKELTTNVAHEVAAFDEDHSFGHLSEQAAARFARLLDGYNLPLQLLTALERVCGVRA